MTPAAAQPNVSAGSGNRAAALFLDVLLLLVVVPAAATVVPLGPYLLPLLAFAYFAAMPLSPLQGTLGKWV